MTGRPKELKNRSFTADKVGEVIIIYENAGMMPEIVRKLKVVGRGDRQSLTGEEYEHLENAYWMTL